MHDIDLELQLQLEGKHEEAWLISEKLQKLGPENIYDTTGVKNPEMWIRHSFNRGWFLLQQGDYQGGCKLLEYGRHISVYGSPPLFTKAPIFNPDKDSIKDKSIIISLEGGYGDEIIHARFATSFKKLGAKKVYLASAPELMSIFSRIEGVDGVITRDKANTVEHDFWAPGFSAGWLAGHTFDNFPGKPYITPLDASVGLWNNLIQPLKDKKLKVGIRWAGNPQFEHQQFRKFPPEFLINLCKYKDIQVYSLQRDHNVISLPNEIIDLQHFLISWEDTIAAISHLDIVITSCTSIAHLAAAMGKKTWIMVPILPYHTWAYRCPEYNKSPYYESVTLFRQTNNQSWNETFQSMYRQLEEEYNLDTLDMPNEDKDIRRLNLGCGQHRVMGFHNVDIDPLVQPDEIVDLNQKTWPWKDNEFSHIFAKDVLEHLGHTGEDFIHVIKEMYRISEHNAIWEIQVPHWRCDLALDDVTHRRLLTLGSFMMFDQARMIERAKGGMSDSLTCFKEEIDLQVCDVQFDYVDHWQERINSGAISTPELNYALNTFNNVAKSMRLFIQVHKPNRVTRQEIEKITNRKI